MTPSNDESPLTNQLPDFLVERLDTLEPPELRMVHKYVEQRLESMHPPIEEQIREEAAGDVLSIETDRIYTLVKMRSPSQGESNADSQPVSLYHVVRERHPDGEEALHWSFLGDIQE
ncbi:hypothetical protein [Natronorubrum thiooxidans]|uniref:Uncharacterized protein n=1 Tax=Natronorubrum thiooxidans TaxID=308853 RepID=A0A1N7GSS7_9EURY|nr:hypothetical protein [Natronorubrum thiooxidans]SIS15653.1 hypothetical protein SAMN05421752_11522 [Natronorubrum thiooxidans]